MKRPTARYSHILFDDEATFRPADLAIGPHSSHKNEQRVYYDKVAT